MRRTVYFQGWAINEGRNQGFEAVRIGKPAVRPITGSSVEEIKSKLAGMDLQRFAVKSDKIN